MRLNSPRLQVVSVVMLGLAVGIGAAHQWQTRDRAGNRTIALRDFDAFYCGGATRNSGGDLYLSKDFVACGGRLAGHAPLRDRFDSPAPLPGYDVTLFAILEKIPYKLCAYAWLCLSLVSAFGGAIVLSKPARLPMGIVATAFALPTLGAIGWGQIVPVAMGMLCLAAYSAENGMMWLLGFAVIATAIEPHVGFPVILSAAIWLPRSRVFLAIGTTALILSSAASGGIHGIFEYFIKVTPLHVMAEVPASNQYSLTWLLHSFGMDSSLAIRFGSVWYAAMVIIGVALAKSTSRYLETDAAIVLVPAAFSVLGGPFIHGDQMALALPAILLFAGRSKQPEPQAWIAAALLSVSWWVPKWQTSPFTLSRIECILIVGVIAAYASSRSKPQRAVLIGVSAIVIFVAFTTLILKSSTASLRAPESASAYAIKLGADIAYASGKYGEILRDNYAATSNGTWQTLLWKIPYWIAPIMFASIALKRIRSAAPARKVILS